jgi:hypothetical protein
MVASTLRFTNSARTWASNTAPGSSLIAASEEFPIQARSHTLPENLMPDRTLGALRIDADPYRRAA